MRGSMESRLEEICYLMKNRGYSYIFVMLEYSLSYF